MLALDFSLSTSSIWQVLTKNTMEKHLNRQTTIWKKTGGLLHICQMSAMVMTAGPCFGQSKNISSDKHQWHLSLEIIPLWHLPCLWPKLVSLSASTFFVHIEHHTKGKAAENMPRLNATADGTARFVITYYIRHGNICTKQHNMRHSRARLKKRVVTRRRLFFTSAKEYKLKCPSK